MKKRYRLSRCISALRSDRCESSRERTVPYLFTLYPKVRTRDAVCCII